MKTISLPIYSRPSALQRMLESLRRNNTEGWTLHVSCDDGCYGNNEALDEMLDIDWIPVRYEKMDRRIGLTLNTFLAPALAFAAGSDFNLYLEDDLILSPDALDLCNWYASYCQGDTSTVGLKLWRPFTTILHESKQPTEQLVSTADQGGHGNGFCCTRSQWEAFWRKEWFGYGREGPGQVWDRHTDIRLRELGLHILSPLYPRSVQQRIDGTHGRATDNNPLTSVSIYDGPPVKSYKLV